MTSRSWLHRLALLATLLVTALALTGSSAPAQRQVPVVTTTLATSAASGQEYEPPWSWPLSPTPVVLRQFDRPEQPWLPGHRGVDLAADEAARILSPATGRVVFAGWVVDRPVVTVDHGGGVLSSFEPVNAILDRGRVVREGQLLGTLASGSGSHGSGSHAATSHCPSSCLHWGVRVDGEYVNPLNYVTDRRPSVLLPLHGP
ncbi:murein hydrolase activator EnvC [Arthrobacter sp. CAN_C5]|uniref:murein hydrolase activator EnvC family protein n=1 Tax=Arthrobacter sp. CAN_C5 TaxID=2760706 RepID=UPI001AE8434B|nr:M23 family metallopeptidase [Arthrobacter sp. CAN_C5]MBP2217607.1 murein DD-endopeptidase MepM/ murein hydrolase activator NlpD [Arthrobacter sp. CAN_C5]